MGGQLGGRIRIGRSIGREFWRVACDAQSMDLPAISNMHGEWKRRSRSKAADALFARLVSLEPDLARVGARSLADLIDGQQRLFDTEPWKVTSALIRQFPLDELVGLALLVRLSPGLLGVARALDWGRCPPWYDAEALSADVVSTAWEVLHHHGGTSLDYPERTILRAIRRRLESERAKSRQRSNCEQPAGDRTNDLCDPAPIPVLDELAMALRLHEPQLPLRDLELIFRHRVLGLTFREIAAVSDMSVSAIEQRSYRAEAALCA